MSSYIKSYKLLNFQSWNDKSAEIPLETDVVNIIEGANETGKSVLYKVLYNFCFPGYWAPSELIRRGCSAGVLLLQLEDDTAIIYALKTNSYTYILIEPDGTKTEWTNQGCPDAIIERMGLILDRETKIILNIIDSDVALPFIKTSPAFNASLIRAIVEPESMTKFFQNLADTTTRVDNAHRFFGSKAATLQEQLSHFPIIDPNRMENQKAEIDRLLYLAEMCNSIEPKVDSLFECMRTIITEVENPACVADSMQMYDSLEVVDARMSYLCASLEETITEVASPEIIKDSIQTFDALTGLLSKCVYIENICMQAPATVNNINLDYELKILGNLSVILTALEDVETITASDITEVVYVDVKSQIEMLETLNTSLAALNSMHMYLDKLEILYHAIDTVKTDINTIVAEVGICPTCGQLLGGQNDTYIHNS